jgi:cytochrome d ubiquinol oxidase subunit I
MLGDVMSPLMAARAQMGLSLVFHIVFAAIGIGLPLLLVIAEGMYLRTGHVHYLALTRKWAKATGLLFAVGAVSGTALSFELGLLWPKYMQIAGAVAGPAFGLEGFAFFIEAIFIGLYLYGWNRLTPRAHWLCGIVIAVSGAVSGVLVLAVNAWMQLPVGFAMDAAGNVTSSDPAAIFKTYAWAVMSLHSTLACYSSVPVAVAGIYAPWAGCAAGATRITALELSLRWRSVASRRFCNLSPVMRLPSSSIRPSRRSSPAWKVNLIRCVTLRCTSAGFRI